MHNPYRRHKWFQEFASAIDMSADEAYQHWCKASEFFRRHKITMHYRKRTRDYCFSGFKGEGTCYATLACGLGAFLDYLDAPSVLLKQFGR